MGKFKMIDTLKSVLIENEINERMYCSSYTDDVKKKFCYVLERTLSQDAKKGFYGKYKNKLVKKLDSIYGQFQKKNKQLDIVFDDIKNYQTLFDEKISFLERFIDELHPGCKTLMEKSISTLNNFKIDGKKILMYKKKVDENEFMAYSFLNRLNTNYSALAILLTDLSDKIGGIEKKPEEYLEHFFNSDKIDDLIVNLLSKPNDTIQTILNTITDIRKKGNYSEDEYKKYLTSEGIDFEDFSDDFGLVDFLGVDLLVKYPELGYYSPVQIKSAPMKFNEVQINRYEEPSCKCFLIYPIKGGWKKVGSDSVETEESSIPKDVVIGSEQIINCKYVSYKNYDGRNWVFCNKPFSPKPDKAVEFIIFKNEAGVEEKVRSGDVRETRFGLGSPTM